MIRKLNLIIDDLKWTRMIFLVICIISSNSLAQDKLWLTTSVNAVGGTFADGSHTSSYYLYGGFRYQAQDFSLSLSLPFVINSSNSFTQIGGMYFPNGGGNNNGGSMGGGMHGSGVQGTIVNRPNGLNTINAGIGDLFIYGTYHLIKETYSLPEFSVNGSIKLPTASTSSNIGTGEIDFSIAGSVKKYFDTFLFFAQTGYLFLGNSAESNINNPLTFSAGVGNNFGTGNHLFLIEYDSYSTVVNGFASPKQLSLGYNYLINQNLSYLMIGSVGLNNSTSDYTISAGFNFGL